MESLSQSSIAAWLRQRITTDKATVLPRVPTTSKAVPQRVGTQGGMAYDSKKSKKNKQLSLIRLGIYLASQ